VWHCASRFGKAALQDALPKCIPVADIVGWGMRRYVQFDFRKLFLDKGRPLRVATDEQLEAFAKYEAEGVLRVLRRMIVETCPSVVLAVFTHLAVIDATYIQSLMPRSTEKFVKQNVTVAGERFDWSVQFLHRQDVQFHDLPSGTVTNFSHWSKDNPLLSWGDYVGGPIYRAWLSRLKEHNADLEACYKEEHERVEAVPPYPLPSRSPASSSSSNQASFFLSPPPSTHPAASGSTPASANAGARAALLAMQLGAATAGMSPPVESAVLTDFAAVFEETHATGSRMFTVLFKHNNH